MSAAVISALPSHASVQGAISGDATTEKTSGQGAQRLRDTFDTLGLSAALALVAEKLAQPLNPTAPKPRIAPRSHHFLYAILVANGVCHTDACEQMEVSPRTAERWRQQLCEQGRAYYGRDVLYEILAARIVSELTNTVQGRAYPSPNPERN